MANRNTQGFGLMPAGTLGSTPAILVKVSTKSMRVILLLYTTVNVLKSLRLVTLSMGGNAAAAPILVF